MNNLLEVSNLRTWFEARSGAIRAVDGVDFTLRPGRTLGIVGESGSGKSVTALSIMRLVDRPGRIQEGSSIVFDGRELTTLPERQLERVRGSDISMIFQEPMTSLNPVYSVGDQIAESVRIHRGAKQRAARERALEMLKLVGIPEAARRLDDYPHQLSGGMRQRVMIAMALACKPDLLIADEPTTALDVTIQAQILDLLKSLQRELGTSVLMITHDLGVVAETCDEVVVMYAGRVVEQAPTRALFQMPRHPYTAGLLRSVPSYGDGAPHARLQEIEGMVPALHELPKGCKFVDRCPAAQARCQLEEPPLVQLGEARVRCHYPLEQA
jgi:oligopeptide/dipeptide ABC transporter ATP-binding protein